METAKMKGSQVNELVVSSKNLVLFHDQYREGFVFLDHETIPLRSKRMRLYLTKFVWDAHQKPPSAGALTQAIDLLKAMAIFNNPEVSLCNRVGKGVQRDDSFYYDLGKGKAIRTTPQGWAVCDAPILFRRYCHQKEQVTPIQGGDPWALFEFINVEPEYRLLLLDYLISCLVPNISHPVNHMHGDHGGGKTTGCVLIKDLIDPSSLMAQSIPRDLNELIQVLAHHYFPVFDNVSSLPDWMSDVFSQACTGGGLSKRKLYTDDEDIIYSFKRPIALNAINVVVHKPDLMDRSILFPLERIRAERRRRESELRGEFENLKPSILGGMFDTLSKAMTIYPMVQLPWTPRMADFGAWGFAIAEALEIGAGEKFLQAYQRNIDRQIEEVIQINALAQAVLSLMENQERWQGTIGDAWKNLYKIAGSQKDPSFPKNERTLRTHLATIRTVLQRNSIFYEIYPRSKNGYPIIFTRNPAKFGSFGSPSEFAKKITKLGDEQTGESNEEDVIYDAPNGPLA